MKKGLETLPVVERSETSESTACMEPRFYEHAMAVVKRHEGVVLTREFASDVTLTIETAAVKAPELMRALGEISAGRIRVEKKEDEAA